MDKLLLIGIDGADFNIVRELLNNNKLKNLASISENGYFSRLVSTIPPLSPAAWTSIFTGVPPHKHGIWGFLKQKEGEYFYKPITSKDRKHKAIWNLLTEKNKRSIIVNIPFSYPPGRINGIMITGLGSPGKDSNFVYPQSLKKFILDNFPNFDVDLNEGKLEEGYSIYKLEKNIIKTEEDLVNLFIHLLNNNDWDFSAIVLRSLDVIQHFAFDNKMFVEKHYERIDKLVGRILEEVVNGKEDIKIIIASDHGFRKVYKRFYVNTWLEKEGYLKLKSSHNPLLKLGIDAEKIRGFMKRLGLKGIVGKIEHSKFVKHLLKILPSSSHQYLFNADWSQTKAFFYRGSNGLIKINVEGREPQGCVNINDVVKLSEEIKSKLEKIVDPTTGTKVFRNVFLKWDLGIDSYEFPEIILLPNEGYEICDYNMNGYLFEDVHGRPGDHGLFGIFMSNFEPPIKVECVWDVGKLIKKEVI
ncbi:alkaline phosphatase family protein [Methanocaldococcus sp.]|uniref:alkaline phosphatase family protein n=1 Tax=Methanocaldococcus sp. TaxID=2152917 RepID=UPI00260D94AB|nr:alkaline phosphatase family protein [Methanocaldococcus sp.]MCQ6254491.1 alkaline phosphatase family protein [Methanocaldococcus sp.]